VRATTQLLRNHESGISEDFYRQVAVLGNGSQRGHLSNNARTPPL
jgi:hypothetical protein